MKEVMLELKKLKEPTPPKEEVLTKMYMAMYKKYISGYGYLNSDQVGGLIENLNVLFKLLKSKHMIGQNHN